MKNEIFLSIVIPAYKEEKRIRFILEAIVRYQKTKQVLVEVIVVQDGVFDNTETVVRKFSSDLPLLKIVSRTQNRGKGYSIREGVLAAQGEFILFADADNSTPVEQVDKLLEYATTHEVVIGSRYCAGGKLAVPQSLKRILGSRALNIIIRLLATRGIKDTQCGFKLFQRAAAYQIFSKQRFERFSFDIEILAIARILGYTTKEVGISWSDHPHSTVRPLQDGLRMILDAWLVRKNIIMRKYRKPVPEIALPQSAYFAEAGLEK